MDTYITLTPEIKEVFDTYKIVQEAYHVYFQTMGICPRTKQSRVNSADITMNNVSISTAGEING